LRLLVLLLGACTADPPTELATPPSADPAAEADLLGDPQLYAAKGAPTTAESWDGPWVATVLLPAGPASGAHAMATALGLPTHPWDGRLPAPARGELAVIWLEPGAALPAPSGPGGRGSVVAVLGPGDTSWAAEAAAALPWLGVDVVDAASSTALWADPSVAVGEPAVAGLVAARVIAAHFDLPYTPPPSAPAPVAGLAQHLVPSAAVDLVDPRARATAALAHPDMALMVDREVATRLALASSTTEQAVLIHLARDPEPLVRARAADRLERVPLLAELCWDPSSVVRVVAAHALARLAQRGERGPKLQQALADVALRSPDAYQRWKAAFGLGWLPGQSALLAQLIEDPDVDVRREAAAALGMQADELAVEALAGALDDPNSFMRSTAVRALATIGDPRSIPALEDAASDSALLVAGEAAIALRRHGRQVHAGRYEPPHPPADDAGLAALLGSADATTRKDACKFVAGRADAPALLGDALNDPDPEVRKSAVQALGAAPGVAPMLVPLLDDPDPDVVVTTLESLRRIGAFPREPVEALLEHPDAEQRLRAVEALASLGPHGSIEDLGADPDERVRAAWARAYPERVTPAEPSLLVRRTAAAADPEAWTRDPSVTVRALTPATPDLHAAHWALGLLAREDDLLHMRFSFNDEAKVPHSHRALRPPVVREYGHPNRG